MGWSAGDSAYLPATWAELADALLARELARRPRSTGDALSALRVPKDEVQRLVDHTPEPPDLTAENDRVAAASAAFRAGLAQPSLLGSLRVLAGLDDADLEVLAFLLAVELDGRRQRAVAHLQDDVSATRPSLTLLANLLPPPHAGVGAVGADSPLVSAALIEVGDEGPWGSRVVQVAPATVWTFAGDQAPDPDLPVGVEYREIGTPPTGGGGLLLVNGADRQRRIERATVDLAVVGLLVTRPPGDRAAWAALIREATLGGAAVVLEVRDELPVQARAAIERARHLWWVVSSPSELPLEELPDRPWREVSLDASDATPAEWREELGAAPPAGLHLDREKLRLLGLAVRGLDCGPQEALGRIAAPHLGALTVRVKPERTWDDLVLPADQLEAVKELVARYRHRTLVYGEWGYRPQPSAGIIGLFSGQPGTGKTLAAEIVAHAVGCDLFKLDISTVVSKYIGETEKNLEAVFKAAETGEAVLFFDEADSLFGKRSEVKDAHDRYANVEVAYLLQRLERHDGMVLLATNLAKNLDPAFERRINVSVTFPLPREAERRTLWQKSFPPAGPREDLDFDWLVRWEITGGLIRNTALTAAFLAADAETVITMPVVAAALRRELQKSGRLLTAADFAPYGTG